MDCLACGKASVAKKGALISPIDGETYFRFRCRSCGLEFFHPRPMKPEIYEGEALAAYHGFHKGQAPIRDAQRRFLDICPGAGGSLLDVGCGNGAFLSLAAASGYRVYGIDSDPKSVEAARRTYGLKDVRTADIMSYAASLRAEPMGLPRFDVVTAFEVLEHQPDPGAFVTCAFEMLRHGGVFAGSVPNAARLLAFFDRGEGGTDLPPHHFTWWTAKALKILLRHKGFHDVQVEEHGGIAFDQLTLGWQNKFVLPGVKFALRIARGRAPGYSLGEAMHPAQPLRATPAWQRILKPIAVASLVLPLVVASLPLANLRGTNLFFIATKM